MLHRSDALDERAKALASSIDSRITDGVLVITATGAPPRGGLLHLIVETIREAASNREPTDPLAVIVDLTGSAFDVSGQEVRTAAQHVRGLTASGRVAFHVSSDFQFGLCRMFGVLCEESPIEAYPFRALADAEIWVTRDRLDR